MGRDVVPCSHNLLPHILSGARHKWAASCQHKIQDDTQAPDVPWGALILLHLDNFWDKVWESTPEPVHFLSSRELCAQAKVDQCDGACVIHHDVLCLQVSVHNALVVAVAHGIHYLPVKSPGLFLLHASQRDVVI